MVLLSSRGYLIPLWCDSCIDWIVIGVTGSDILINIGMRILGVNKTRCLVIYKAIRTYGHLTWIVGQNYDPVKGELEKYLLDHYNATSNCI